MPTESDYYLNSAKLALTNVSKFPQRGPLSSGLHFNAQCEPLVKQIQDAPDPETARQHARALEDLVNERKTALLTNSNKESQQQIKDLKEFLDHINKYLKERYRRTVEIGLKALDDEKNTVPSQEATIETLSDNTLDSLERIEKVKINYDNLLGMSSGKIKQTYNEKGDPNGFSATLEGAQLFAQNCAIRHTSQWLINRGKNDEKLLHTTLNFSILEGHTVPPSKIIIVEDGKHVPLPRSKLYGKLGPETKRLINISQAMAQHPGKEGVDLAIATYNTLIESKHDKSAKLYLQFFVSNLSPSEVEQVFMELKRHPNQAFFKEFTKAHLNAVGSKTKKDIIKNLYRYPPANPSDEDIMLRILHMKNGGDVDDLVKVNLENVGDLLLELPKSEGEKFAHKYISIHERLKKIQLEHTDELKYDPKKNQSDPKYKPEEQAKLIEELHKEINELEVDLKTAIKGFEEKLAKVDPQDIQTLKDNLLQWDDKKKPLNPITLKEFYNKEECESFIRRYEWLHEILFNPNQVKIEIGGNIPNPTYYPSLKTLENTEQRDIDEMKKKLENGEISNYPGTQTPFPDIETQKDYIERFDKLQQERFDKLQQESLREVYSKVFSLDIQHMRDDLSNGTLSIDPRTGKAFENVEAQTNFIEGYDKFKQKEISDIDLSKIKNSDPNYQPKTVKEIYPGKDINLNLENNKNNEGNPIPEKKEPTSFFQKLREGLGFKNYGQSNNKGGDNEIELTSFSKPPNDEVSDDDEDIKLENHHRTI